MLGARPALRARTAYHALLCADPQLVLSSLLLARRRPPGSRAGRPTILVEKMLIVAMAIRRAWRPDQRPPPRQTNAPCCPCFLLRFNSHVARPRFPRSRASPRLNSKICAWTETSARGQRARPRPLPPASQCPAPISSTVLSVRRSAARDCADRRRTSAPIPGITAFFDGRDSKSAARLRARPALPPPPAADPSTLPTHYQPSARQGADGEACGRAFPRTSPSRKGNPAPRPPESPLVPCPPLPRSESAPPPRVGRPTSRPDGYGAFLHHERHRQSREGGERVEEGPRVNVHV